MTANLGVAIKPYTSELDYYTRIILSASVKTIVAHHKRVQYVRCNICGVGSF